jgi:lipopolysaccharide biosynthesis glycosyltransferase
MMETAKEHVPEIPIALCAAKPIGVEDVFIKQPDSDVGGRRAKLKAYELAPAEWQAVLYLDVDTEIVSKDVTFFFDLIEDGWEFVICKDPHLMDTMHSFRRPNNLAELAETEREIVTLHTLQFNGGVWAFGRNDRVKVFFDRWQEEWEKHAQRDQGALIRALYADPLKIYVLGNEWNFFNNYSRGIEAAAVKHYPGRARRWNGLIPGRIDSKLAWNAVKMFENTQRGRRR